MAAPVPPNPPSSRPNSAASDDVVTLHDPADGRRWRFDADFLASSWECRWGCDCAGILDEPAPELQQGCCSVGAELLDRNEAMQIAALALTLDPALFQHHDGPDAGMGSYFDPEVGRTLVVDGACVFLNRPGFPGGAGCALHLGAVHAGESPIEWKPSVCWQLPLKVVETNDDDGVAVSILRRWERNDWGPGGDGMAWVCTEQRTAAGDDVVPSAYVGDRPVIESLAEELEALLGPALFTSLRQAMDHRVASDDDET